MKRTWVYLAVLTLIAGCQTAPQRVKIAVPVPCVVQLPTEPLWATDALPKGASLWEMGKAALAELEQRRAYELKLRAAAQACS